MLYILQGSDSDDPATETTRGLLGGSLNSLRATLEQGGEAFLI